jgi:hypothetical protein
VILRDVSPVKTVAKDGRLAADEPDGKDQT